MKTRIRVTKRPNETTYQAEVKEYVLGPFWRWTELYYYSDTLNWGTLEFAQAAIDAHLQKQIVEVSYIKYP